MKRLLLLSLLLTTFLTSCHFFSGRRVRGNGQIMTETRKTGSFTALDVSGAIDVYLRQDSVSSVKIETDGNILPFIEISADGGVLDIRPRNHTRLRPTRKIKVYVSSPRIKDIEATGACNVFSENKLTDTVSVFIHVTGASDVKMELATPKVEVEASGASNITLKGETKDLVVTGSGSTDIRCYDLMAENARIDLSGAGDAQVFASVKLEVEVSGAADVKYKGNPQVNQQISGAGSVKKTE